MIVWLSAVRKKLSGRRRPCVDLSDDEVVAQFESGQYDTATKVDDGGWPYEGNEVTDAMVADAMGRCGAAVQVAQAIAPAAAPGGAVGTCKH